MSLDDLKAQLPDYAKDIRLNLSSLANDETLEPNARYGCMLACALASRHPGVIRALEAEAKKHLSDAEIQGVKAAAAIMGMNNVYYRFLHLVSSDDYKSRPAKLRMNIIANPGVDKTLFELWSLAVSAVNACGMCIDSHEAVLRKASVRPEQIQAAVRIASVVHAAAQILDGEDAVAA